MVEPGVVLDVLLTHQLLHRGYQSPVAPHSGIVEFVTPTPPESDLADHPGRFEHRAPVIWVWREAEVDPADPILDVSS